ncbi:MAG: lysophospholipid acyltransferase family protein [Planctomycetota bacterium]
MLAALRQRQPGQPLYRILWWHLYHGICFLAFVPLYRFRAHHVHRIPRTGPILFVANHQSYYDPIIVGLGAHFRQFFAMARATLWRSRAFRWMTVPLNPIPVEQGTGDVKAIKRCVQALKDGQALLVFPEGARTPDGSIQRFEPGVMLLIKRAKPTVIPVALDGAYDVWPIHESSPKATGRIGCIYGHPIPAQTLLDMKPADACEHLRTQVANLQAELRTHLHPKPRRRFIRPPASV